MFNKTTNLVFTYGTLKKNHRNHKYLESSEFLGNAETTEQFSMRETSYDYPAVIETSKEYTIPGELYRCSDETLKKLDKLEGIPDLFYRKHVPICYNAGVIYAWVYFYNTNDPENRKILKGKITEWR